MGNHCLGGELKGGGHRVGQAGDLARDLARTRPYIIAGLIGEKTCGFYVGRGEPGQVLQQQEVPKAEKSGRHLRIRRTRQRATRALLRSVRHHTRNPTSQEPGSPAGQGPRTCSHCFLLDWECKIESCSGW